MRRRASPRVPAAAWAGIVVILERLTVEADKLLDDTDALLAFLHELPVDPDRRGHASCAAIKGMP